MKTIVSGVERLTDVDGSIIFVMMCRMSRTPGGRSPLKVVVATQACEIRWRRMMAKLPHDPPRLQQTTAFAPHTLLMIVGVRAFTPRSRIEKRARMRASACQSAGPLSVKTVVRLESETKSSRSMFTNKLSLYFVPCVFPGQRPRTSMATTR